jgi:penicillin amidase
MQAEVTLTLQRFRVFGDAGLSILLRACGIVLFQGDQPVMRSRVGKIGKILLVVFVLLLVVIAGTGLWLRGQIQGSLPQVAGEMSVPGLTAQVTIERDAQGIPTLRAENRRDLAFATGFVHGQDRFFQLDLLRRNSAGEIAELVGPDALELDRKVRIYRFRERAKRVADATPPADRALMEAYAAGVNAGLDSLGAPPFEYFFLGSEPAPWRTEDSVLVLFSMYLDLQGDDYEDESTYGVMRDVLPPEMFTFLTPRGTEWDAPIEGEAFSVAAIPGPEVFDLRKLNSAPPAEAPAAAQPEPVTTSQILDDWRQLDRFHPGSNNWAVAGTHTEHGGAIVANDMHLGIRVPHIWYRARYEWKDDAGQPQQMTGVTLPGTPATVVGSNGHVAWGFTNSEGDWVDLVVIEPNPADPQQYLTPDGPKPFEHVTEMIKVAGQDDHPLEITETIWGPIIDRDHQGRQRALKWVALETEGVNLGLLKLESAQTLEEALTLANACGGPAQNFTCADDRGQIGWTIMGRIPRRVGFDDGRLPVSWADGSHRWDGWLESAEYPKVVNPPQGRIWTANARVVGGEMYALLGDGGLDLGARQKQIRDDLLAIDKAREQDMLDIQLDDRAIFLERWQQLLLSLLTPEIVELDPDLAEVRQAVENWQGRAAIDSTGYTIVRTFRRQVLDDVIGAIGVPVEQADHRARIARLELIEGPLWKMITQRPQHLLNPNYETWEEQLIESLAVSLDKLDQVAPGPLAAKQWGKLNATHIKHPLSAVPGLARWLNMPSEALPGDSADMPRIQAPEAGASQRMGVSPGREELAYLHMPCGQSGHPLSPHYGDGHQAWSEGQATPLLPGETVDRLVLLPEAATTTSELAP